MRLKESLVSIAAWNLLFFAGCGSPEILELGPGKTKADADAEQLSAEQTQEQTENQQIDDIIKPPQGYYDAAMTNTLRNMDDPNKFGLVDDPQLLFVNFGGATVSKGFGNGQSFILCKQSANIPAAGLSAADTDDILGMVQQFYNDAGAKLVVTGQMPTAGEFTTMHVGGSYADLGCLGRGILGVAPFDTGNINRSDVGFAFTQGVFSNRVIAETIAHEAGHSFGLDHIDNNAGVMYFSSSPNITGFTSGTIRGSNKVQDSRVVLQDVLGLFDGSAAPIPLPSPIGGGSTPAIPGLPTLPGGLAGLPGLDQIGAIGQLLPDLLGAGAGLDLSTIAPLLQGLVGGGVGLGGLDQIFAAIGLASNAGQAPGASGAALPIDLSAAQGILGGLLGGGAGGIGDLTQLIGLAGFGDITQALGSLQGLFGGAGAAIPVIPGAGSGAAGGLPIGQIPDLSSLLGILGQTGVDPTAILGSLVGSTRVVNANYVGDEREALLSMLKVAYSQAYQKAQAPTK